MRPGWGSAAAAPGLRVARMPKSWPCAMPQPAGIRCVALRLMSRWSLVRTMGARGLVAMRWWLRALPRGGGGGLAKGVASLTDPNPLVAGQGFARLRAAGVAVQVGPGAQAARELN